MDWEPEAGPVVIALRTDPSHEVRVAAAHGLIQSLWRFGDRYDRDTQVLVLGALGRAMTEDQVTSVRYTTAYFLASAVSALRKREPLETYWLAAKILPQYAEAGTRDADPDVADQCQWLLSQFGDPNQGAASGPG